MFPQVLPNGQLGLLVPLHRRVAVHRHLAPHRPRETQAGWRTEGQPQLEPQQYHLTGVRQRCFQLR